MAATKSVSSKPNASFLIHILVAATSKDMVMLSRVAIHMYPAWSSGVIGEKLFQLGSSVARLSCGMLLQSAKLRLRLLFWSKAACIDAEKLRGNGDHPRQRTVSVTQPAGIEPQHH
jgi:hypothetical protein